MRLARLSPALWCSAGLVLMLGACRGTASLGAMDIAVSGLPASLDAAVTVSGPAGFHEALTGSGTLTGLSPGAYAVRSDAVSAEALYLAEVVQQSVVVAAGATAAVAVRYVEAASGALELTVTGLPGDASAAVTVTGPQGFEAAATGSAALEHLVPGDYTVSAAEVSAEGEVYVPGRSTQAVTVTADETASVTVESLAEGASLGSLVLTVDGLGPAAPASVSVTGPDGFSDAATASTTFNGLQPGDYSVYATEARSDLYGFAAQPAEQVVAVAAGESASAAVTYTAVTGAIEFVVNGLPSGTAAGIDLLGPHGRAFTIDASKVLPYLEPGAYAFDEPADVVTAADVTGNEVGFTYGTASSTFGGEVAAGETALAAVLFEAVTGSVRVEVAGLPDDSQVVATVAGHALTGSATINNLAPGAYRLEAYGVVVDGFTYHQDVFASELQVAAGKVVSAAIEYRPVDGKLAITIDSPVEAKVTLSGPGIGAVAVQQSTTFTELEPGSYEIVAQSVTTGKFGEPSCRIHLPSPTTQTQQVAAGELASARVEYATVTCAPPPPP